MRVGFIVYCKGVDVAVPVSRMLATWHDIRALTPNELKITLSINEPISAKVGSMFTNGLIDVGIVENIFIRLVDTTSDKLH